MFLFPSSLRSVATANNPVRRYSGTITHHEPAASLPRRIQQLISKPIIIGLSPQSTAKWIVMIRWQWLDFFFTQRISPEIIISKLTTYRNANAISLLCNKALTWRWVTVVSLTQIEQILVSLTQKTQACDKCVNLIADNVTVVSASKGKKK